MPDLFFSFLGEESCGLQSKYIFIMFLKAVTVVLSTKLEDTEFWPLMTRLESVWASIDENILTKPNRNLGDLFVIFDLWTAKLSSALIL